MNQVEALKTLDVECVSDHEGIIYTLENAIDACTDADEDERDYDASPGGDVVDVDNASIPHWTAISNRMVTPISELLGNDGTPISTWDLLGFMANNWGDDMDRVRVNVKGEFWFRDELLASPTPTPTTYPMVMDTKLFEVMLSSIGRIGFQFENGGFLYLDESDSKDFMLLAFPQASVVVVKNET